MEFKEEPMAEVVHIAKVVTMADGSPRVYLDYRDTVKLGAFDPFRIKGQPVVAVFMLQEDWERMTNMPKKEVKFDGE